MTTLRTVLQLALITDIELLLAIRLLQGVAAGAATVVAPPLVRATLPDEDAVKGLATISMVEAMVPAGGPLLGALLLPLVDWRGLFVMVAAVAALLLTFVASAPQLLVRVLGLPVTAFATLQVCGVAAFMTLASQSGRISRRLGTARAVQIGSAVQVLSSAALLAASAPGTVGFAGLAVYWVAFCGALAVRGPPAVSDALALPPAQMGRASALLVPRAAG